ncbi:hypothetical protein Patl1_11035 [Pistacia atlantica]|uniref:Uncharacterized protein n=1 Tax=Pistacia atlantica TaxID=434234 RepID=A0ACC1A6S1_9ROSI|nr:hypothetical protein Patl1_11035 [Pistacia atlantica]
MVHFLSFTRTIQLLFYYSLIATFYDLVRADPPYHLCPKTTNYSANSPSEYNRKNLFNSFTSNASVAKLFNTSSGNNSDRVYGQYMCLNYVQNYACINCIKVAAEDAVKLCPGKTEAVVWEESCQLRYSNENFLGRLDVTGNFNQHNPLNISEPERYRSAVKSILRNLTKEAAFDPSTQMYVTGNVSFTDTDTLYALVQCTTDLSADDCNKCLQTAIANISSCCYFSLGARLLSRSCYLRYELYAFYAGVSDGSKASGKGKQRKRWMLILAIVLVLLTLLALLPFTIYCIATKNRSRKSKVDAWNVF